MAEEILVGLKPAASCLSTFDSFPMNRTKPWHIIISRVNPRNCVSNRALIFIQKGVTVCYICFKQEILLPSSHPLAQSCLLPLGVLPLFNVIGLYISERFFFSCTEVNARKKKAIIDLWLCVCEHVYFEGPLDKAQEWSTGQIKPGYMLVGIVFFDNRFHASFTAEIIRM